MKKITLFSAIAMAIILSTLLMCTTNERIHIYSNENNDLYQLLVSNKKNCIRYDKIETALEKAKENETLLILARNYPEEKTTLPENFFNVVEAKQLNELCEECYENIKDESIKLSLILFKDYGKTIMTDVDHKDYRFEASIKLINDFMEIDNIN